MMSSRIEQAVAVAAELKGGDPRVVLAKALLRGTRRLVRQGVDARTAKAVVKQGVTRSVLAPCAKAPRGIPYIVRGPENSQPAVLVDGAESLDEIFALLGAEAGQDILIELPADFSGEDL